MNERGVTLTGKVLRQLKERWENAWTRTQPVELGYHMVALGGLNVAYQFRADFLTRHMDQQQNQTFWMQAAISRIHHDVRSPEWLQGGLQVWQWTRYRMVRLVQETSFGEPWLSNKKTAQLCGNLRPAPPKRWSAARIRWKPSEVRLWEKVQAHKEPAKAWRNSIQNPQISTDQSAQKYILHTKSVQKTSLKKLQQIAVYISLDPEKKWCFLCLWHLRQSCGESVVANPPNPKEFQLGSVGEWFRQLIHGPCSRKGKKLKMKDMYGGWKLQILLGLFQESDFFYSKPSSKLLKYGDLWENGPPAEDQSWPSDPQIPFEKRFEPHMPPVFFGSTRNGQIEFHHSLLLKENGKTHFQHTILCKYQTMTKIHGL